MAKKILFRFVCVLCLAASLAMYYFVPWVKVFGLKDKDLKEARNSVKTTCKEVSSSITKNSYIMDAFEDAGLELSKSDIKSIADEIVKTSDMILSMQYTPCDVSYLSFKAIKLSKTVDVFLEDEDLMKISRSLLGRSVTNFMEAYGEFRSYLYYSLIYTAILAVIAIFGVLGIIFSCVGKCRGFVVTYFILNLLFVLILIAAPIFGNIVAHSEMGLSKKVNIYPFVGSVAAFVFSLVALIFSVKDKKWCKKLAAEKVETEPAA